MKLTAQVKLQPTPKQAVLLRQTLETANAACNEISMVAWEQKLFRQFDLHHLCYHPVREKFKLSAQVTVRCIGKVADSYKTDKKTKRAFKNHGAVAYDNRILRWYVDSQEVSIWTMGGRQRISFLAGPRQLALLAKQRGESDLALIDGEFFLFATCDIEEPETADVDTFLGVDRGVKNIATTSDGENFSSGHLNGLRSRYDKVRKRLQQKGTKSSRRLLKKRKRKEHRFAKDVNHRIAKRIVLTAKDTDRGIALENLKGIRSRITVRKKQRRQHNSWAFNQLGQFIEYKAQLVGVPVVHVDPRNTSRTCIQCGCIDKRNRKSQAEFLCIECGFFGHADTIAAINIGRRAVVNQPNVSDADVDFYSAEPGTSSLPLGGE